MKLYLHIRLHAVLLSSEHRIEFLVVVTTESAVFWNVTPCSLVKDYTFLRDSLYKWETYE
jgi:hypothetical protein